MKTRILIVALLLWTGTVQGQLTSYLWARPGESLSGNAGGKLIESLPDGGCISSGNFDFFGLRFDTLTIIGSYNDSYLVKHDASGNPRWGRSIGGGGYDYIDGLHSDMLGKVYICGQFQSDSVRTDTITFHNQSLSAGFDAFALVFDTSGTAIVGFKPDGCGNCGFRDITTDDAGNIYIVGDFSGFITFDSTTLTSSGNSNMFAVGYRPTGERFLLSQFVVKGSGDAKTLDISQDGKIAVAGLFYSDSLITQIDTLLNSNNAYPDGFALVMDTSGNQLFSVHAQGSGEDKVNGITFAPDRKLWILVEASAGVSIGGIQISPNFSLAVWVCADSAGNVIHYSSADAMMIQPTGFATDNLGRVYVSGRFSGLNIQSGAFNLQGNGGSTAFWLIADTTGTTLELKVITNGDNIIADDICVNLQNDVFLTGGFLGYNDFILGNDTLGPSSLSGVRFDPWLAKVRGIGSTTGIVSVSNEIKAIDLFPNPTAGDYIQVVLPLELHQSTIEVQDARGRICAIYRSDGENAIQRLSVSRLEAGIYLLHASNGKHTGSVRFVLIR